MGKVYLDLDDYDMAFYCFEEALMVSQMVHEIQQIQRVDSNLDALFHNIALAAADRFIS